jgi:arginine/lysine/ornithine decarboxylase
VLLYTAIDGWRRQMVQQGKQLLGDALDLARSVREQIDQRPGLHVLHDEFLHEEASSELDILHVLIDLQQLGITGFQAADWVREQHAIDVGLSDHRRIEATISTADDDESVARLLNALDGLVAAAPDMDKPPRIDLPSFPDLEVEPVLLPRDAFFGPRESVPASEAAGRVAAEQITPYPPGIPALVPGERIPAEIVDYLRSGVEAGMVLPDAADPKVETFLVTALP